MLTIKEKTQIAIQILIDALELRSAVKHPRINKEPDKKTGEWKVVKYTGDIEEMIELGIDINKFGNENIYPDEVDGIMAKAISKCGFTYHITYLAPMFNGPTQLVLRRPADTSWAKIIKNLKQYATHKFNASEQVYLEKNGDLWREPKERYCYPMGENSDRHKIVRYIAIRKTYQQTSLIAETFNKSAKAIRSEMGKIRGNISRLLKISSKKVIEGKGGSGYRAQNIKLI